MRIAQIAPLAERCPPVFYGGTERVVSYLTEELVEQGHDVTLFASGDSITAAELVACAPRALLARLRFHRLLDEPAQRARDSCVLLLEPTPVAGQQGRQQMPAQAQGAARPPVAPARRQLPGPGWPGLRRRPADAWRR